MLKSFQFALKGIAVALSEERNLQIHVCIALCVILAGWHFHINLYEWMLLLICFSLVLSAELFNSALETLVDLASPDFHPLAGKAKDMAAGAVLITAIFSAFIGILIFGKYLVF